MQHKPGTTLVTLFDPAAEMPAYAHSDTVLVAVNDDSPFLFDSLLGEVTAQGARLRAVFHPVVVLAGQPTSVIVLVFDMFVGEERRGALVRGAEAVFAQVRVAVRDWRAMRERLNDAVVRLKAQPPRAPADELAESLAFLEWLGDNHFTFLGCRDYSFSNEGDGRLDPVEGSGLGVLADSDALVLHKRPDRARLTPQVRDFLIEPTPLIVAKSNKQSLVHRRVAHGLYRRQVLRPRRRLARRAALRRPVHLGRLQPRAGRHPAAAPQGENRDGARRPGAGQP